jgi:hypothetical protein
VDGVRISGRALTRFLNADLLGPVYWGLKFQDLNPLANERGTGEGAGIVGGIKKEVNGRKKEASAWSDVKDGFGLTSPSVCNEHCDLGATTHQR